LEDFVKKILFFFVFTLIIFYSCNKNIKNQLLNENSNDFINIISSEMEIENSNNIMDIENENINDVMNLIYEEQKYFNDITYLNIDKENQLINISELINEFVLFCPNNSNDINWENVQITFTLFYEGSDIPKADMIFFSNSIMVLKSKFFSENLNLLENRFYKYSFNNDRLELQSIDTRSNALRWLEVERWNMENGSMRSIFSVNDINNIVIYNYRNGIYYSGFGFFDDY